MDEEPKPAMENSIGDNNKRSNNMDEKIGALEYILSSSYFRRPTIGLLYIYMRAVRSIFGNENLMINEGCIYRCGSN
ncbi:hypothetical protein Scep_005080 [Stephania cephalantha]|uniref:Uncharacterized protein n=1 Tax=Stephania cephalantha TaxID=152367 RepID=A0AAP0KTU6_9MAGN